ncbi:MAG: serine protease [Clostridium lundense]|nr:serine protease [Clostridium lundense]
MKRVAVLVSTIAIIASLASGCSSSSAEKLTGANNAPIAIENGEGIKSPIDIKEEISKVTENKEANNVEATKGNDNNVSEDKTSTSNEDQKEVTETNKEEVAVQNSDECITDTNDWTNVVTQVKKPQTTKPVVTRPVVTKPVDKPETTAPVTQPEAPKPTTPENNVGQAGDSQVNEFEKEVVRLTNIERSKQGLKPLTLNVELSKVARIKSKDMVDKKYFDHNSPTYGSPFDMMKSFGISYRAAGENIAYGQRTPEEVVKGWMNSPGHRANILNGNFTEIGAGFYNNYWTQMFIGK